MKPPHPIPSPSFDATAELFASPAATYGGKLIDSSLKLVEKAPKPAGYEYGAVDSAAGSPVLFGSLLLVVATAALVPYFLSIGESAQTQQRVREASDKTNPYNQFAAGNKNSVTASGPGKKGVVVGVKRSSGVPTKGKVAAPVKKAAAPVAAPVKKATFPSFGGAKTVVVKTVETKPAAKRSGAPGMSFGKK